MIAMMGNQSETDSNAAHQCKNGCPLCARKNAAIRGNMPTITSFIIARNLGAFLM